MKTHKLIKAHRVEVDEVETAGEEGDPHVEEDFEGVTVDVVVVDLGVVDLKSMDLDRLVVFLLLSWSI